MDKYTKAVLTVIAVCLVIQTTKDIALIEPANANTNQVHKIALCTEDGTKCAGITSWNWTKKHGGGQILIYPDS